MGIWILSMVPLFLAVLSRQSCAAPQRQEESPRLVQGKISSIYNFPFVCSHHYQPPKQPRLALGTCTIMTADKVFFSVDTVDRVITGDHYWFSRDITDIKVIGGSDILSPSDELIKETPTMALRDVKDMYLGRNSSCDVIHDPDHAEISVSASRNALGELECDIGLYVLGKPFEWGKMILPIPLRTRNYQNLNRSAIEWVDRLESWPFLYDTCSVVGWGPVGNNELIYHELSYVTTKECMEVICDHHASTCLEYPVKYHHVCFKSRQYGDVCVYDQGSPVFCPWFGKSIFAILTRTFDCGLQNMPAVYTLLPIATDFYRQVTQTSNIEARPNFTDIKYIISTDI